MNFVNGRAGVGEDVDWVARGGEVEGSEDGVEFSSIRRGAGRGGAKDYARDCRPRSEVSELEGLCAAVALWALRSGEHIMT